MPLIKSKEQRQENRAQREAVTEARRRRDANPAIRFEYKVKWIGKDKQTGLLGAGRMETIFNKFGSQGWELVSMNMERAVFKRAIVSVTSEELEELAAIDEDA